jgi:transcriptional regulator with XRE-family HTH domain
MKLFTGNLKTFRNSLGITQNNLADLLSLEQRTIAAYETGQAFPSMQILIKMTDLFGISLDYLYKFNECPYPRNLKLLKLAKSLDVEVHSEARSNMEGVIKPLLSKYPVGEINLKQDYLEIDLGKSFQDNLKEIRNLEKLTQPQLGSKIGISRSLVAKYEYDSYPAISKLFDLSVALDISMHALVKGEKLCFDFDDRIFGRTILSADNRLSFEDQKILIHILEAIINNKT